MDYKKAYDMIPQKLIIEYLKMLGFFNKSYISSKELLKID